MLLSWDGGCFVLRFDYLCIWLLFIITFLGRKIPLADSNVDEILRTVVALSSAMGTFILLLFERQLLISQVNGRYQQSLFAIIVN